MAPPRQQTTSIVETSGFLNWQPTLPAPSEAKLEAYKKVRKFWKEHCRPVGKTSMVLDTTGWKPEDIETFWKELRRLEQEAAATA